jgi:capsular exopolysaccharide synthesis family protein
VSKIFDALSKAQGDVASLALPLIEGAGMPGPAEDRRANVDVPQIQPAPALRPEPKQLRVEDVHVKHFERVVFHTDPSGAAADKFRLLRMRLRDCWAAGKLKSVLITSPLPGEGKSTTALNLATALAEERTRKVLLVDGDLHRGSLNDQLGLNPHVGLGQCLTNGLNPLSALRRVEPFGWYFLCSGQLSVGSPTELLQPQELAALFQKLVCQFDWIVVDSPPVLALSDAVALRQHMDATLLVARAGSTSAKAVEDAIALLGRKHIIGLVLNGIEKIHQPYGAYYQYQSRTKSTSRKMPATDDSVR